MRVLRQGLTWLDEWVWNTESAYSVCCKLRACNSMSGREFADEVFGDASVGGVHNRPRSLVWTDWVGSYIDTSWKYLQLDVEPSLERSLAEIVYSRGVQLRYGEFARYAASDEALRYCPECISDGFHSVLCQFDAIAACPRHGIPLLDFCRTCGQRTGHCRSTQRFLRCHSVAVNAMLGWGTLSQDHSRDGCRLGALTATTNLLFD